jgi:hypothetical protein
VPQPEHVPALPVLGRRRVLGIGGGAMLAGGLSLSGLGVRRTNQTRVAVRPLTRAMPDSVIDVFIDFTTPLEGRVSYLYLDGVGLVTVGLGCMLESVGSALPLPFVHRDDMATPATQTEIRQAFSTVMARQDIRGRHTLFEPLTDIRLTNRASTIWPYKNWPSTNER